jgi:nitroimidazol reductase NimA-like FMN-containing flavoprotein (pyridoxamine 5'-phosphate oxidase superfamily)
MPRTTPTRFPERAVTDRAELDTLFDDVLLAHVGLTVDDHPVVLPTGIVLDGDRVIIHGSTGSRWMRALADGAAAAVSVTALDAVVVARTGFESSFQYRSAVLFGTFTPLEGLDKIQALGRLTNRLIPGRLAEVRASTAKEVAATLALAMPIGEWSLKSSHLWPEDLDEDIAGDAWAGVVPVTTVYGPAVDAPDLRPGVAVAPSVSRLTRA